MGVRCTDHSQEDLVLLSPLHGGGRAADKGGIKDCLIIGYNDGSFDKEVEMQRSMGADHPNYRDLRLNFIEYQGKPYRAMDILDHFYYEGREQDPRRKIHNTDVLWMVVMYLGTYLHRRGFSFDYVNLFQLQKDELREKLQKNQYLTTVITTTIYNYDTPIIEAVDFVRQHNPKTKIIVGGPYIAKRSESMAESDLRAVFDYIGADLYVRSREGEQALVRILRALKQGASLAQIPNIAYRDGGDFVLTHDEREINALHENLIDYSLFPKRDIGSYVNLRITKGCPFKCSFCSFPLRTEKYDVSNVSYIQQEMDQLHDLGTVTGLFFIDDTVNVPLNTFKDMMRMMIRRKYGFRWHCFFRADFCDEELVDLMKMAGCKGVFLGLESANDRVLANMDKTPRKHHYLAAVPLFKAAGIRVFASLFFGFPGDTLETAHETMDFLEETKPEFYRPLIWYCDPVTPVWKQKERYGIKGYHFSWSHDTMNVGTACDLVKECFFRFDVPVWVPDPGFNFVSLYLLENRGMSFDQIDTFLRCFNAVVREQVAGPALTEPAPDLIESLRRACQFDRIEKPDVELVEAFSAAKYSQAEEFWCRELAHLPDSMNGSPSPRSAPVWEVSEAAKVDHSLLEFLKTQCEADSSSVLLALYAAALWAEGRDNPAIAAAIDDAQPVPLRLQPSPDIGLRRLVAAAQQKLTAARSHRRFVLPVLSAGFRRSANRRVRPRVDLGYLELAGGLRVDDSKRFPSPPYCDLELICGAYRNGEATELRLLHAPDRRNELAAQRLVAALRAVTEAAASRPDVQLRDIPLAPRPELSAKSALARAATVEFTF